jgi:hypothetical protein
MSYKQFLVKKVNGRLTNAEIGKLGGQIDPLKLGRLKSSNCETYGVKIKQLKFEG